MTERVEYTARRLHDLRTVSALAAVFAFGLVVWGGVVRIAGAGMSCPDWPRCRGSWFPVLNGSVFYEWTHRFGASVLTLLIAATAALAWRHRRRAPSAMRAAAFAVALVCAQIVVGAATIAYANNPPSVAAHLAVGIGTFVSLLLTALLAWQPAAQPAVGDSAVAEDGAVKPILARWASAAAAAAFVTAVAGGYMSAAAAGIACSGFPLCNGWSPAHGALQQIHMLHRWAAYATILLVACTLGALLAQRGVARQLKALCWTGAGLASLQAGLGVLTVNSHLAAAFRSWHQANGVLLVGALAALTCLAYRRAPAREPAAASQRNASREAPATSLGAALDIVKSYLALTKLNVMSLLLFTTLTAMLVAARGVPSLKLVFWTLFGGALAAGCAAAINMYLDRDIDAQMKRTRKRPIPSGKIEPAHALGFGLVLGAGCFAVLALRVNALSAALSLAGILHYVLVYTLWLKRSSTQNIVIGGAAGAVPSLVGWAAVTNHLGVTALLLFGIVFLWTPPHFWALALLAKDEYRRVGIPMLPVIRGDIETRRQIVAYSVALLAVTLVAVPLHLMGMLYLAAALGLDAVFLLCALWVARAGSPLSERIMYRYSMLYLALLFSAMVIDRLYYGAGAPG
jgi:protoheme IX farnesyltransferase